MGEEAVVLTVIDPIDLSDAVMIGIVTTIEGKAFGRDSGLRKLRPMNVAVLCFSAKVADAAHGRCDDRVREPEHKTKILSLVAGVPPFTDVSVLGPFFKPRLKS